MNITLGFRLAVPVIDPQTMKVRSFENIPFADAKDRISEAQSIRVQYEPAKHAEALEIARAFQAKHSEFRKLQDVDGGYTQKLLVLSKGAPDNTSDVMEYLKS